MLLAPLRPAYTVATGVVGDRQAAEGAWQLEAADEAEARTLVRRQSVDPPVVQVTLPALIGKVPLMQLTSVVLPEPFGRSGRAARPTSRASKYRPAR